MKEVWLSGKVSKVTHQKNNNPAQLYLLRLDSKRSRRSISSTLKLIANALGHVSIQDCPWEKVRRIHVIAIKEKLLQSGFSPATINTYLCAIRGTMHEAWTLGLINSEDYMKIKDVKSVKGSRLSKGRALSEAEVGKLLQSCKSDDSKKGARDLAIISLLYGCGLRRAEIVSIDVEDIYWTENTIKLVGKGNIERVAYMPDSTALYIKSWLNKTRGTQPGALFTRIRRWDYVTFERLSDQAIYNILLHRQKIAGIEKCSPHDMRRTFGTRLLDMNVDIITVRDAMGHVSVNTTQKYDKRGTRRLKEASKLMSKE
ncbi:tyrosine-type recombinase/integrase [Pseudoalteromonas luteoviolacea]|nr:site-specific integrase [Pseudoalteromonas luteoviolacea]